MPPTSRHLPRQAGRLLAPGVLVLTFVAQALGALLPQAGLLVAGAAVGLITELVLHRWQKPLVATLARLRADVTLRQVLRDLLLMVGLVRMGGEDRDAAHLAVVLGLLSVYGLHFVSQAGAILVRRSRTLPFATRNIDTSGLRLSSAPPALLLRRPGHRLLGFGLPATVGLTVAAGAGSPAPALAGIAVSVVLSLAGLVRLLVHLLPSRRALTEERALEWLDRWLAEYGPTSGMYFSGGASSAYQANMWLEPLAELPGRPLIVLRERFMVQKIGATDLPILCLPKVAHLMRLEHTTLTSLIHPANSGKTSQVLRIPSIKHAFVNHGESDKLSSCNPYAKAYDEVWVAGPAARERYALADVGVEDKDIVEIGRPQLKGILAGAAPSGAWTTVLYAPTWEGWDGNPGNTSVIEAGENLVRRLLADPKVRLIYKPHPMTGSVDPRAGAANARIQELIRAASTGAGRPAAHSAPPADLERITAELDRLTAADYRTGADEMERMLVQGVPSGGRDAEVARATERWAEAYWASLPEGAHQIITEARPSLYSCFNEADLLISDVSSVVSDYLASGKPYAVANTSGVTEAQFRADFPTVSAATILTPDADGVPALLAAVRDPSLDALATARAELKEHLLGPDEPSSQIRFARAVESLSAASEARLARVSSRDRDASPRLIPTQSASSTATKRAAEAESREDAAAAIEELETAGD